ncbi:glucose-1-phosphate thymidylyltransferase [Flexistipes sinusarabici DSM 4947]|uniref:Glucose-1-phosphate thymidylyltransferase n=1 Tax=Flexistipes sinusarabici (strain ATCC 49648 / DSM 4947 / MAS 10) TaxID=717231 RepID=F8E822_FLESM|nr:glucose-1-phosphate thymidylyltransferase RfbA [Flexistipes sinusarabici]AEI13946.1 glucose-1-phosphate thymidylyltransferase [Flexistipes sinusarabici DSM 4947]
MKGIILAGGRGSRLFPVTKAVCKQLLPVYDKPMIYYPLSVLMLAGINEILIISTPEDVPRFQNLLGNGSSFGLKLKYKVQKTPRGLAEAFILGEEFIGDDDVCLILGDNLFYGDRLTSLLKNSIEHVRNKRGARIFGYWVKDPQNYGVAGFDELNNVTSLQEKPENPKSNYALVGLYFYDNRVVDIAKNVVPSERGELEITSVNEKYLNEKKLSVELLGRGYAWLDTGTHHALLEAGNFIRTIEDRQGLKIGCIEEIAFHNKWIDKKQLQKHVQLNRNSQYGDYLEMIMTQGTD